MPDLNDVVRHVILRIIVDQAGLAEELAAAREKLKALKDSEKEINRERGKNTEQLTKAIEAQNQALGDNRRAQEAAQRASTSAGRSALDQQKDLSDAIKANTKAVKDRTVEEAKAAQIDAQTRQKELDAQRARSAAKKKDAQDDQARAVKNADAEEAARQKRLKAEAERRRFNQETANLEVSNETLLDGLRKRLDSEQKQRDLDARARRKRDNEESLAGIQKILAEAAKIQEVTRSVKLGGQAARTTKAAESAAKVSDIEARTATTESRKAEVDERRAVNQEREKDRKTDRAKRDKEAEERKEKAAQRDAQLATAQEEREQKAAARDAERAAAKEAREQKAAQRDAERAAAKDAREQKTADREAQLAAAKEAREQKAAQRDAERAAAKEARERKAAALEADRESKRIEREQQAAEREQQQQTRSFAENVQRAEQAAYAESERRRKRAELDAQNEEKRAERETKRIERQQQALLRRRPILQPTSNIVTDIRAATGRVVTAFPEDSRMDYSVQAMRKTREETGSARAAVASFFQAFKSGDREAASVLQHITSRVRAVVKELKPESSAGGGGNFFNNLLGNISDLGDGINRRLGEMTKHLFSFRGLIVAVIVALGPLAAILGAVGAAALGLASNLVALSGAILALPGLIGAAVAAFGGLAIVMAPLSNVFSAFSAAQKEAAEGTKAAADAQLDYRDALLSRQQAELGYQRALQDLPRAQQKLSDARRQAAREIEDYRLALQKLRHDEEGAALGVESAELEYRKSLVDPTKTGLDRRIARHDLEGAYFDQRDQNVAGRRLLEDSSEAFRKGVEGSDQVISALRGVQDATLDVQQSYIAWQKAILAVEKAQKSALAGGTQAAAFQAQLDALPPKTRKVVEAILDLADEFKALRKEMSENIFGPLSADTGKFADVLDLLRSFMLPASVALGELFKKAVELLTNPEWKKFFSDQGKEAAYIVQQLGDALLSLAGAFKGVVESAAPFVRWMVDGIKTIAAEFDNWTNSDKGRKAITDFLELTKRRIDELWPVIKNFAAGFAGIFAALNSPGPDGEEDFTTQINKGLLGMSETFRKFGEAARDPNSGFQKWLRDVLPLVREVGHFLGAVVTFFGDLFSDPDNLREAENLLRAISDKWLPKLAEIFDSLSRSEFVSKIASAIGSVFSVIQSFFDHGGVEALSVFATILQGVAAGIAGLVEHVPILMVALGALAVVMAAVFGAAMAANVVMLISKITGLSAALRGLKTLFSGGGILGGLKDAFGGKDTKDQRDAAKNANLPEGKNTNTGSILSTMYRMEKLLQQIRNCVCAEDNCTCSDDDGPDKNNKPTDKNKPNKPGPSTPAATVDDDRNYSPALRRIEAILRQIAINTGGMADVPDIEGGDGDDKNKKKNKRNRTGNLVDNLLDNPSTTASTAAAAAAASNAKKPGWLSRLFGGAADVAEDGAKKPGFFSKLGGSVKGGVGGIAASLIAMFGGQALVDNFVKDDKDKDSLNNAITDTATYAGLGSMFGPVGTGIGAGVGLVKNYATDKNFRDFAVDKLPLPAPIKALVSGDVSNKLGDVASNLFGRSKDGETKNEGGLPGFVKGAMTTLGAGGLAGGAAKLVGGAGDMLSGALGGAGDIGKSIVDSLKKAGGFIADFFTKTIPGWWHKATSAISGFFTKTLPSLPGKAFDAFFRATGRVLRFFLKDIPHAATLAGKLIYEKFNSLKDFFLEDLPRIIAKFFTKTIPHYASEAWGWIKSSLWDPFVNFIHGIPAFFTDTIPQWFSSAWKWFQDSVVTPVNNFITVEIPKFFTETIPAWFAAAPGWFDANIFQPLKTFFTETLPNFITTDLPNAIKKIPGWIYSNLVQPVIDFFTGLWSKISEGVGGIADWAKGLFNRATSDVQEGYEGKPKGQMSGGLIEGVYQGIQDTAHIMATPGEFMVRKSKVDQPGVKAFLRDFNEDRITMADLYGGLSAATAPQVMSIVPPDAGRLTGAVPTVVNNTVNHAPLMGDVTIHNPVRERSEYSLRRQLQIANIRHRR